MEKNQNHGFVEKIKNAGKDAVLSIKTKASDLLMNNSISLKKVAVGVAVLTVFSASAGVYKSVQGYRVFFNGEEIGMVRQTGDFMAGLDLVRNNLSEQYDANIILPSDVRFERAIVSKDRLLESPDASATAIEKTNLTMTVEGAVIVIEEEEVAALKSYEEAEEVLDSVIASYAQLGENEVIVSEPIIAQDYEIVQRVVPYVNLRTKEDAVKYIMQGTDEIIEYEVKPGDTSWDIAVNRGINVNELVAANSDKDITSLRPGDVLKLTEVKPYLDVEVVKEMVYSEKIPFETTYQTDASIYVGKSEEVSPGVNGVKEITALVTYRNGVQVAKEITNEEKIKDSVNRVVARGTKPLPPAQGTGRFRMPTSGRVTAINKAGSHAGSRAVDIANGAGTSIYASDSGRVTRASWYSGYGYAIIIDHGNGYSTLYGHLSSMNVSVGQNVTAGQRIAGMGSTGNSSGSHLHFEIRRYGARQVITRYFSYLRVGGRVSP